MIFLTPNVVLGVYIKCNFVFYTGPTADGYNCQVEKDWSFNLIINQRNTTITRVTGKHLRYSSNVAVERLFFLNNPDMKFIPIGYATMFANIKNLWVANCPIESIEKSDFVEAGKLEILGLRGSNIEMVDKDVFWNLINLEQLHLYDNKITKIHEESLSKMTNLKILNLPNNKLSYLPRRLFQNNVELQEIHISNNKLKIIESQIFLGLTKITKIELRNNLCINKNYPADVFSSLVRLNQAITDDCANPMTELINEINQAKAQAESTISKLQLDKSENDKKLFRKDNEISNLASVNQNIRDQISKLQEDYEKNKIEKAELEQELIIMSLNHTEARLEIENVFNKTFALEIILSDLNQKLNESLEAYEEASNKMNDLQESIQLLESNLTLVSEENSELLSQVSTLVTNLTDTLGEKEMISKDFHELELKYLHIVLDSDKLKLEINELDEALHNETSIAGSITQEASPAGNYKILFVLVFMIFVLSALLIIMAIRAKKAHTYSTNENAMEVAFNNAYDE